MICGGRVSRKGCLNNWNILVVSLLIACEVSPEFFIFSEVLYDGTKVRREDAAWDDVSGLGSSISGWARLIRPP